MTINLRLNPDELARLSEIAKRECRKPDQQARYLLLEALGLRNAETKNPLTSSNLAERKVNGFEKTTT